MPEVSISSQKMTSARLLLEGLPCGLVEACSSKDVAQDSGPRGVLACREEGSERDAAAAEHFQKLCAMGIGVREIHADKVHVVGPFHAL